MAKRKLVLGADVEQCHLIVPQLRNEIIARYRFKRVARLKEIGHDTADLGNIPFADAAQSLNQRNDFDIARQTIENVLTATFRLDEVRPPENLQVPRRIGKRQMRPRRQLLNAAHPLREM